MDAIIDLLNEEDEKFITMEKKPRRKKNVKIDDVTVKPLTNDDDDYIDPPNPNLLRIPFSLLLISPKGSGKTTVLHNIMMFYKGMFDQIFVYSPTINLDKKWEFVVKKLKIPKENRFEKCREGQVSGLIERVKETNESLKQKDKIRTLMIFDDCVENLPKSKKISFINRLAMNHRHYFISHIIVSQSFKRLDPVVRLNTTGIILFNTDNTAERMKIIEELAGNLGRKKFEAIWIDIVSVKFAFCYINYDTRKIHRNFDEVVADLDQPPEELMFALQKKGISTGMTNKDEVVKEKDD